MYSTVSQYSIMISPVSILCVFLHGHLLQGPDLLDEVPLPLHLFTELLLLALEVHLEKIPSIRLQIDSKSRKTPVRNDEDSGKSMIFA